uniref:[phosphatase 2A protein]-leucine-carboxy methyltransferase n=2 Tax=Cajanus cajan TaxID=3821 RepID=A0A151R8U6_CAJCA|nr:Leucine carboxyl methyltransferase 2 [Cajanus cajan]
MKDDYIHLFVRRPLRRSPIINRGYYARWAAFRKLLYQFLDVDKKADGDAPIKKQILSLGAGFDTTYFQLQDEGKAPYLYVEVDFKEVTSKKAALIETHSQLRNKLGELATISREKGEVVSAHYKLVPADLRYVQQLNDIISVAGMDPRYVWGVRSVSACVLSVCFNFSLSLSCTDVSCEICYYSNAIDNLFEDIRPF